MTSCLEKALQHPDFMRARLLSVRNAVLNVISGEAFFRPMMNIDRVSCPDVVQETLPFTIVPALATG